MEAHGGSVHELKATQITEGSQGIHHHHQARDGNRSPDTTGLISGASTCFLHSLRGLISAHTYWALHFVPNSPSLQQAW